MFWPEGPGADFSCASFRASDISSAEKQQLELGFVVTSCCHCHRLNSNSAGYFIGKTSTCHTERRKTTREEREAAMMAVIACQT
jgi:hypothetical protein